MSRGRHRRPRQPLIPRQFTRLSVALTAGGAGIAAPLVFAGTAGAAPVSAVDKPASLSEAAPKQQKKSGDTESYTVTGGDTLHKIATAHDIEGGWQTVYQANRETVGDNPHLIFPGQELTLGAPQSGAEQSSAPKKPAGGSGAEKAAGGSYADNLDGWIREALDIMQANGIPGSYEGIHRNIIRESGGDPNAINNWDINAQKGTPSIGLLQVIKPTFDAYHVAGTANDQRDPVANIVAACNYAADRYGSIDNVNGPY